MTLAYLDCSSGIAGDMLVAAMLDAGLPLALLERELAKLPLGGYKLSVREVEKHYFRALHFTVECDDHHPHRHYSDIRDMIMKTAWEVPVRETAVAIFKTLGEAEAKVHGCALEEVHFHEVGAVDSIIDICSVAIGFHHFGIHALYASPVNVGSGEILSAHGVMPVPAPAVIELSRGIPIYSRHAEKELATPTGMAILATLAKGFGVLPAFTPHTIGCGAGTRDLPIPNIVRLMLGEEASAAMPPDIGLLTDEVVEIEADIDDMNPEWYGHIIARLLEAGALDVVMLPAFMKKNRSGTRLTILIDPAQLMPVARLILQETTTLGLRYRTMRRIMAKREIITRETPFGAVRFKYATMGDTLLSQKPEYEDCSRIAVEKGLSLKEVYARLAALPEKQ